MPKVPLAPVLPTLPGAAIGAVVGMAIAFSVTESDLIPGVQGRLGAPSSRESNPAAECRAKHRRTVLKRFVSDSPRGTSARRYYLLRAVKLRYWSNPNARGDVLQCPLGAQAFAARMRCPRDWYHVQRKGTSLHAVGDGGDGDGDDGGGGGDGDGLTSPGPCFAGCM